jgi:hypothetical protein
MASAALRRVAICLHRLGRRLLAVRSARSEGVIEFHAEAGALEGALYVDGKRVGTLPGVKRL